MRQLSAPGLRTSFALLTFRQPDADSVTLHALEGTVAHTAAHKVKEGKEGNREQSGGTRWLPPQGPDSDLALSLSI